MKYSFLAFSFLLVGAGGIVLPTPLFATSLFVSPAEVIQGEPFRITLEGAVFESVSNVTFDGKELGVFLWDGKPTAFAPIDLNKKPGTYKIIVRFRDGTALEKEVAVGKRDKVEAPLGIPEKLGGNTPQAQTKLVSTLSEENQSLLNLRTGTHAFWKEPFRFPVANPIVTDPYGYSRKTGAYSIAHKGTDFRAKEGTAVLAMNRGVVRLVRTYRNYGKTIVVDHGLGLMTFYMHLSKINVKEGQLVLPGQVIGLAGKTGYAEEPHLHLTVRLNDISIDPMKFLALFNER